MPPRRSRLAQDPAARPTLEDVQSLVDVVHGLAPPGRTQKFPEAASPAWDLIHASALILQKRYLADLAETPR
jgi:hypothetical protein